MGSFWGLERGVLLVECHVGVRNILQYLIVVAHVYLAHHAVVAFVTWIWLD